MSTLIQPESISLVRRQFLKACDSFDSHSVVFQTVSDRLLGRLELLAIEPARVLDLGCRSGYQLEALSQRYPDATIIGADPAPGQPSQLPRSWPRWLWQKGSPVPARIACDPHHLPFPDASIDLVVSNLLLPWCEAPHRVFEEVARVLSTGGAFMFSSAGPDTLMEYRQAWASIDSHLHSFGLIDMHDLGDTMMASGFSAPVLDRDNLIVDYPDIKSLQAELQSLGAANLARGRRHGLMARGVDEKLDRSEAPEARFPVTLELIQGHGWKGELREVGKPPGDVTVSVDSLRGSWRKSAGRNR